MAETIVCPKCGVKIEVAEVLTAQLRTQLQKEFTAALSAKEGEYAERESCLALQKSQLDHERAAIDAEVASRLEKARNQLCQEQLQKAKDHVAAELNSAQSELIDVRGKLKQAQDHELELRRQKRELEEQKASLELDVARRVDNEIAKIRETARKEVIEERQLKEAEKDQQIAGMLRQIEELKRKAEQGSQQIQGEVLEIDLEESLRRAFPLDEIVAVSKGAFGADVRHLVRDRAVGECGEILWESKRTKNWNNEWLAKLRDDQRAAKAQLAILVSEQLPPGVQWFALVEGVWVTTRGCALNLATALRTNLIQVAAARRALEGQQGKMEVLYNYLSSEQFKQRIEGIVEPFMTLREQLESEKRTTYTRWANREKQLDRALASTCALYGDLGGIIGQSLPTIDQLSASELRLDELDAQPLARRIDRSAKADSAPTSV